VLKNSEKYIYVGNDIQYIISPHSNNPKYAVVYST
jgi:hypothetical protein